MGQRVNSLSVKKIRPRTLRFCRICDLSHIAIAPPCFSVNRRQRSKGYTPSRKVLVLYQSNRMFLWIFWSCIDSCWGPSMSSSVMETRLSGLKSCFLGNSYTAAGCLSCLWSARSRLWAILYAAVAQSGLLSEPHQICGEATRNHPWKKQVSFWLRGFVLDVNEASWLRDRRVHLSISQRGFDS